MMTHHHPTYWPHSGMWTLEDGRSDLTIRALDAQLDHRSERIADWHPIGIPLLRALPPASPPEVARAIALRRRVRGMTPEERTEMRRISYDAAERASTVQANRPRARSGVVGWPRRAHPMRPDRVEREITIIPFTGADRRNRRSWSVADDEYLLGAASSGMTHSMIAREMGCEKNAVTGRLWRMKQRHEAERDAKALSRGLTP